MGPFFSDALCKPSVIVPPWMASTTGGATWGGAENKCTAYSYFFLFFPRAGVARQLGTRRVSRRNSVWFCFSSCLQELRYMYTNCNFAPTDKTLQWLIPLLMLEQNHSGGDGEVLDTVRWSVRYSSPFDHVQSQSPPGPLWRQHGVKQV